MNDSLGVCEDESLCRLVGDPKSLFQRERTIGIFNKFFDVATTHEWLDHIRISVFFSKVVDRHDARMRSHPAHRLSFAKYSFSAYIVEAIRLDDSECDVSIECGVVGEVDKLLPTFAE